MLDEGGVGKAVARAQRAVGIQDFHYGLAKVIHQLFGQDILYDGKAVGFNTFVHCIQFIDAELVAIAQVRFLDVTVIHCKLLAITLADLSLQ